MPSLFSLKPHHSPPQKDWYWLLNHITPQMHQALANEAYRILQNSYDAEDVMQESIIKCIRSYHQLRDEKKLFSWMFTIVRREAYACLAKRSTFALLTEMDQAFHEQESWDFEKDRSIHEEHIRVREALRELETISKRIITMRVTKDMNLLEISQHIGLNYHTVRSKYYRALSALRKKMMMHYAEDENE